MTPEPQELGESSREVTMSCATNLERAGGALSPWEKGPS